MAGETPTVHGEYGISQTLADYTIESATLTDTPRREEVPDQKNRVTKEIRYDTRYDLRLVVRGSTKPANTSITYDSQAYIVDSVEDAGSYNSLRRYTVTAHRYSQCSAETTIS